MDGFDFDFSKLFSGLGKGLGSLGKSAGSIFDGFNIDDLATVGGLGFGGLNYLQSKDALKYEQGARDEDRKNIREDRAYNRDVRNRASKLRF